MKKIICPTALIVMSVLTVGLFLRFVVIGETVDLKDERIGVKMTEVERAFVLQEMRDFLVGVQGITQASLAGDMEKVAQIAAPLGMSVASHAPKGLIGKLPLEFKKLGFGIHEDLDQLARDAVDLGDPEHTMQQLTTAMNKCVACHAAYQIVVVE